MTCFAETRLDAVEFRPQLLAENLPLAIDDMSLAHHLGIRNKTMWWMVRNKANLYKTFKLPKRGKSGGYREIQNPVDTLKNVQKNILARFLDPIALGKHVGAYVPERSCRDVAEQHVGKAVIISLDIKDFFPSTKRAMIRRYLHKKVGYNYQVASLLAELMTCVNFVPQGAPTSGQIANLVADYLFDHVIIGKLQTIDPKWVYTRYSDDIDISHPEEQAPERLTEVIEMVKAAVEAAYYRLNIAKTKVEPHWKRQKVLGMVVNEKVNIPRFEYMRLRSIIHNCLIQGFSSQYERACMGSASGLMAHIRGKLAYFKQVDPVKAQRLKDRYDLACQIHKSKHDLDENEVSFDE